MYWLIDWLIDSGSLNDSMTDEAIHRYYGNNAIMATLNNEEENEGKCYR